MAASVQERANVRVTELTMSVTDAAWELQTLDAEVERDLRKMGEMIRELYEIARHQAARQHEASKQHQRIARLASEICGLEEGIIKPLSDVA